MSSTLVGKRLDKYEITQLLGQGGMATVYKGYRADIDRTVAVKVLPPHPGQEPQFVERFKLEARTIARLQHPHILPLYDYGIEDDVLYLVMAYSEGGSLAERIKRGAVLLPEADVLLRETASALDYAHRQGVIHRDIKPDNILLNDEGHVLLADFGIAKLEDQRLTATGGIVGTPSYLSPEQAKGTDITPASDIYSLGVVLYEMLSGRVPFESPTPLQTVLQHLNSPVPQLTAIRPDLPAGLDFVIQRAMAKEPTDRYPTAQALYEDFARVLQGQAINAFSPSLLPTMQGVAVNPTYPTAQGQFILTGSNPAMTPPPPTIIQQVQPSLPPALIYGGFAIIALLLLVIVLLLTTGRLGLTFLGGGVATDNGGKPSGIVAPPPDSATAVVSTVPEFGHASFSTTNRLGDTLVVQVEDVRTPAQGKVYVAWLVNTRSNDSMPIGELTLDASGNGVLPPYVDSAGRLLPALYNAVWITLEDKMSQKPEGTVIYRASVPEELMDALGEIFVTSPAGLQLSAAKSALSPIAPLSDATTIGLLYSDLAEAKRGSDHAGLASGSSGIGAMHTHAEHTINILRGTKDDLDNSGSGSNPGFGVGVVALTEKMVTLLDGVSASADATRNLQSNLEFIRTCLTNVQQRTQTVIDLETQLLVATTVDAVQTQAGTAFRTASEMLTGVDANGNGEVEPFEGECGLTQIETYGLLVSVMVIYEAGG